MVPATSAVAAQRAVLDDADLRRPVGAGVEAALVVEVPAQLVEAALVRRVDELAAAERLRQEAADRAAPGGVELDPIEVALQDDATMSIARR